MGRFYLLYVLEVAAALSAAAAVAAAASTASAAYTGVAEQPQDEVTVVRGIDGREKRPARKVPPSVCTTAGGRGRRPEGGTKMTGSGIRQIVQTVQKVVLDWLRVSERALARMDEQEVG